MTLLRPGLAVLAALAFITLQGGSAAEPRAATVEVRIENFTFSPASLAVKAGTTVTWTNGDDVPHSVVAVDGSFRSKVLDTGDRFSFTFDRPGEVRYFCSLHPHMTGRIVVGPAG